MSARRVASLDVLRGLAALAVASSHYLVYRKMSPTGSEAASILAVEVFFMLSGFVLAPQILRCVREGWPTLKVFLMRRWMRTVPSYWVALVTVSVLLAPVAADDAFRYALYLQNPWRQLNHIDYYPVAWSLSVEEWFYLVFPASLMLVSALVARSGKMALISIAVCFILVVTAARMWFGHAGEWGADVRRVVVFRIDAIAYGFLLYIVLTEYPLPRRLLFAISTIAAMGFAGLELHELFALAEGSARARQSYFVVASLFSVAVLTAFYSGASRVADNAYRIAVFMGAISYPIYLFHLPLLLILTEVSPGWPLLMEVALYGVLLVGFGAIFHYVFERPILEARPGYRAVTTEPISARATVPLG